MVVVTKGFLKSAGVNWNDLIDLEFIETKDFTSPFKYINISNIYHTDDSIYLEFATSSR